MQGIEPVGQLIVIGVLCDAFLERIGHAARVGARVRVRWYRARSVVRVAV